jgi:UMF1 family MFS transporter
LIKDSKLAVKSDLWLAFGALKQTLVDARAHRDLFHFILIHFLILDVVNTAIAFMSIYANKVIGFDNNQISSFLITSTVAAMTSAFLIGWLVKRKGTVWTYWLVLWIWVAALSIAVSSQSQAMFWAVGPLAGMGMGGVWVVSRPLLAELSPAEKVGEFFGLYGLAGRASSIIGPMLWGTIVFLLEETGTFKYRAAIFALLLIAVATLFLFRPLARRLGSGEIEQQ